MIDTHAHLDAFEDPAEVLARARAAGVGRVVNVATSVASARAALDLCEREEGVYAALGLHPHEAGNVGEDDIATLRELLRHPGAVAVGETGLDHYRDLAPRDRQADVFRAQRELAAELLVPPDTLDGYWLTPYGMPGAGSENTTYITGHSWEDREAPFNRLSDPGLVGSEIELETGAGTLEYVVDSVVTHDKDTLKDSDIWQIVPGRLVVVSCYTEDLWGKNVVLTASPAQA